MSLKLPRSWDFSLKMDMSKIVRSQSMMAVEAKGSGGTWFFPSKTLERPLKAGWLKKQRSIVKNWQQRYFVLKGQHLYYFKDEDDLKPQGLVQLHGSTIKEVGATLDEVGKFIFEIIPGDQSRTGQDSCVLMASSQTDMEEWVKFLRRAVGSSLGVVFGQQLVETMIYEQRFGQHPVPILVEKCAEFIRTHGLKEEGIFRLPGQDNLVKQLRDAFDDGQRPSFDQDTDVHTVASLLKLYLRELPEPVVPCTQYEDFLLCGQLLSADEAKGHEQLAKQLALLPQDNYNLLSYICRFLNEIQLCSTTNKMSVENLATVFGVNLIRPKMEDPVTIMKGTPQIQKVMTAMISEHEKLFPPSKDTAPSPPPQKNDSKKSPVPRNAVGWDAVQTPLTSRGEIRTLWEVKDDLESSSSKPADRRDPLAEDNGELQPKEAMDSWNSQTRKRTQTLPNRKCFGDVSSNQGDQSIARNDIFNSSFWTSTSSLVQSGPISSGGRHKRTLSQGLSKFLHFPQASDASCSVQESKKQTQEGEGPLPQGSEEPGDDFQPSEMVSPGQNGPTDPDPDPEDKVCHPEDPELLRKMIVELKEEMEAQRKDYEEQIRSLEKENYEVWAKVVKLKEETEKERSKSAGLERMLQEIRSSRDDMEKKNKLLEDSLKAMIQSAKKN
ncbi:rho GTPase-activating protein 25 [Sceloporus undulatus]|uniref:rho GTPase-activating protein 25 n=1 Tax=Sceloporus undulatus TaxID=8520 RepID=UPI001C4BE197|nr:rho GTPase-activating protein 25 [Sceloporus undulatus]